MKKLLLKTMLLLCALVAGSASVWAESIEINTTNSGVTGSYADKTFDVSDITFGFTQWMKSTNIQAKKSTTNSCYNVDAIPGIITSIVVEQTGTARAITVYGGTEQKPTTQITSPATAAKMTFDFTGNEYNYFSLKTPSNACYFDKITINYTPGVIKTPSINLNTNTIEASMAGLSGTIEVTYNNITDVVSEVQFFEADGTTPATYDWIDAEINASNNVAYTIAANAGAARTAYMKVYALDDEANDVYSELITVAQAKYEIPTSWAAVTSIADLTTSDVFVIVGNNGSTYALSNDKGTSAAPTAVAVTVANNALSGTVADNIKWNISGDAEGYTFYPDGETEEWLYCTNNNNGLRVGTGEDNTFVFNSNYLYNSAQTRYVGVYNSADWRSYTSINNNIKDQTFAFYKKLAVKFNAEGYATFSSTCAIDYSKAEGWTAWVVTGVSGSAITFSQVTGAVPAGTGVLLMGTAGETVYPEVAASGVAPAVNKLQGTTTVTAVAADAFYGLSGNEFVKVNAGTVPAGKALLSAAEVGGVKALSLEFEGTDGISETVKSEKMNNAIYDLSGRRVVKPTKGLYIVNGKKIVK